MTRTQLSQGTRCGQHAVVIGSSMAGLLAARVLSDHFAQVTICERDPAPADTQARKGVPQGAHIHALLRSGQLVIEDLFPGLVEELVTAGTTPADLSADVCWFHHGHWKIRYPSNFPMLCQSRPFLEWHVRRRLASFPNITWHDDTAVVDVLTTTDRTRVTGVQLQSTHNGASRAELAADLIVDASGYGSRLPEWLTALQYPRSQESTLKIRLTYASRFYQPPVDATRDWLVMMLYPKAPETTRAGYIFPVEGQRWIVTLAGYVGDTPPHDEAGFLEYARGLPQPDIYSAIREAKPLSEIKTYHVPEETRRHYEKLTRFPDGLIAVGDAVCRFDPIFGQGMSVAAKEARILAQMLRTEARHGNQALRGFPLRFLKAIAKVIDVPWSLATGEGCRYPQAEGTRPFGVAFLQWYVAQLFALSATRADVYGPFMQVLNLLKDPPALFAPTIVWQVLKRSLGMPSCAPADVGRPRFPGAGS
jgi:2-polyprenyl-6-methoxyphenol hydroxylase-like FAD-dependent oxidoreductase